MMIFDMSFSGFFINFQRSQLTVDSCMQFVKIKPDLLKDKDFSVR